MRRKTGRVDKSLEPDTGASQHPTMMLLSSSYVVDNKAYLGYCRKELRQFLSEESRVLFVPFAYLQHDDYTDLVSRSLGEIGVTVTSAHQVAVSDLESISEEYDAVFCGGGNTFLLLKELQQRNLLNLIRKAVGQGVRYMGSSAGANVACRTIGTTNDMPISEPESFQALGLIPFNINAHYYERPKSFKHRGETRRDRIAEFIALNHVPVLAMREGAILLIDNGEARLVGRSGAILFQWDDTTKTPKETEVDPGESVTFLLRWDDK